MTTPRRLLAIVLAASLLGGACTDDGGGDPDAGPVPSTKEVLADLADGVIVPGYTQLVQRFDTLADSLDTLCTRPDATALSDAQVAWKDAAYAWRETRAGGVGPAMDTRLNSAIGFLARPDSVDELLASSDPIDPASLEAAGAAVKGLSALEITLFAPESEALTTPDGARRCEYAQSVTTIATGDVQEVLDAWNDGYRDELVDTMDAQASLTLVVNEVSHRLTELDDQGLRSLVEAKDLDELPNNRVDGPAGYHLAELRALLAGIDAMLGTGDDRLVGLVRGKGADTGERLDDARAEAVDALADLGDSVDAAFTDDPEGIAAAQKAVESLKVLVSTEVASQLGVTISFSDADGDS